MGVIATEIKSFLGGRRAKPGARRSVSPEDILAPRVGENPLNFISKEQDASESGSLFRGARSRKATLFAYILYRHNWDDPF